MKRKSGNPILDDVILEDFIEKIRPDCVTFLTNKDEYYYSGLKTYIISFKEIHEIIIYFNIDTKFIITL